MHHAANMPSKADTFTSIRFNARVWIGEVASRHSPAYSFAHGYPTDSVCCFSP